MPSEVAPPEPSEATSPGSSSFKVGDQVVLKKDVELVKKAAKAKDRVTHNPRVWTVFGVLGSGTLGLRYKSSEVHVEPDEVEHAGQSDLKRHLLRARGERNK